MSVLSENPITHSVAWRSPSNIALVKYWGKYGQQCPQNPSVSFTLSQSYTETSVVCRTRIPSEKGKPVSFDFVFHGQANPAFALKIEQFLHSQLSEFPFLS
jgi:diphosphomevalonate decarboxylase